MKYLLLLSILFLASCEKFLKVDSPTGQLVGEELFRHDAAATSAMLAVYVQLEGDGLAFHTASVAGLSADEMVNHRTSADWLAITANNITPDNSIAGRLWVRLYKAIYQCNAVINGVAGSSTLTPSTRSILRGEALFMRAWCHFFLTGFYGNILYATETDPLLNTISKQISEQESYVRMEEDLTEARQLLQADYMTAQNRPGGERIRPNRYAAEALLARVQLYQKKWKEAAEAASAVIERTSQYSLVTDLSRVFLRTSPEAILQLQPVIAGYNSFDGAQLNSSTAQPRSITLTRSFFDSFLPTDGRRQQWIRRTEISGVSYFWPFKYKIGPGASSITEYGILLRLSEQYLIRAEARAHQDDLTGAADDLNTIRSRAGLARVDFPDKLSALAFIADERKHELFCETGDRWLNLRRTGQADAVLAPVKGANWASTDVLYPIPQNEMLRHPGMQQNPGY